MKFEYRLSARFSGTGRAGFFLPFIKIIMNNINLVEHIIDTIKRFYASEFSHI